MKEKAMNTNDANLDHLRSEGDLNISSQRTEWAAKNIDAETQKTLDDDAAVFLHQSLSTPCLNVLTGCQGATIETAAGQTLLDFHGNNVHQVGFANPRVIAAVKKQLDELSFCTRRYTNRPAIDLAKKLVDLAPGDLNRVLFAPGGTAAVGIALKLARYATGRHKTISMWDAFHGASLDAVSVGGEAIFRQNVGPLLPGTEHVPPPDAYRCIWDCQNECNLKCADYIEYVLEKEGDVAAVIAETVRSTPFVPPPDYWKKVRAACDKHGALLILDEIPTCLGRTGTMFACEQFDVVPDILVIGKALGGGIFPLAAVIARQHLNTAAADRVLGHYTHEKSPVAAAAALAAIACIEDDDLLTHARSLGDHALGRMKKMMADHDIIGDVRGIGLMLGIELVKDHQTRDRASREAEWIMYRAMEKGLSFKLTMGSILTLTPPLTVTKDEMDRAMDILEECFTELDRRA
jgi:4-aminobutyrate aminotransferase